MVSSRIIGDPSLPSILFLHGFMGSGEDWMQIALRLQSSFCSILIDLPGHGNASSAAYDQSWGMQETSQAIIAELQRINVKHCYLVGYSMGGRIALHLTLNYPEFFKQTILESASPGLATAEEQKARIKKDATLARRLLKEDYSEFLEWWYQIPLFQGISEHSDYPAMMERRLKNNPANLAKSLADIGTGSQPSLWEKLRDNSTPILLISGEKDMKFQVIAERMVHSGRRISRTVIPGCGHNCHFEQPKAFCRILMDSFTE